VSEENDTSDLVIKFIDYPYNSVNTKPIKVRWKSKSELWILTDRGLVKWGVIARLLYWLRRK